ncbi:MULTISPECIES: NAD(P)-binding domain-containing protein [Bacillaceae]|uniref:NAD(P)-binding domain-containing protein n=1 Tax=Bacillaceae TaxID=186817 RepID=UPI002963E399|nr:NAD(P)-binding domain-containing protein [Bacillus infantis]MDW2877307.1 NAD(P)-binding domain-containing protein [Bacillus infantis]
MLDVIIIGSGPYGISLAAHALGNGLSYKIFGYPMDFWKNQMPQDMFIRTPHDFVSFSDPEDKWTVHQFAAETGIQLVTPLPRTIFTQYASWFAEKAGIIFTPQLITHVSFKEGIYEVVSDSGEKHFARNVVVATGVEHYKYLPEMVKNFSPKLVSHTSGYTDFSAFKDKKVIVLGSGQSAWEAAGLLKREGAEVELVYRAASPNYAGSREAEIELRDLGNVFFHLTEDEKKEEWGQSPGSIAHFLKPYVDGIVPQRANVQIQQIKEQDGQLLLKLSDGTEKLADHLLSASGFHIDLDKAYFINAELREQIDREQGFSQFPRLSESFESNIPGLYFAGPLSSHSHGPTFRFILGLRKTACSIISGITETKEKKIALI